jgi:hypothetical protein
MFEGTAEELKETKVTQRSSIPALSYISKKLWKINPEMVAGHSLENFQH